jgi:hypothetical protein
MRVINLDQLTRMQMAATWADTYVVWSHNHAISHIRALNWLLLSTIKPRHQRIQGAIQNQRWSSVDYQELEIIHKRCGLWSEAGDHYG